MFVRAVWYTTTPPVTHQTPRNLRNWPERHTDIPAMRAPDFTAMISGLFDR